MKAWAGVGEIHGIVSNLGLGTAELLLLLSLKG